MLLNEGGKEILEIMEKLPTHCSVCGKRLDAVEVFFNGLGGYFTT